MQEFMALANGLADTAGEIARSYFRQPFEVISKADESPVTVADRTIEQRMREMIEKARPEDGIFGEEFGIKESRNGLTWVLDPIDGTKAFIIGKPTFGTLIALCEEDVPVLGVIDQAISQERWIGLKGVQSTLNGKTIKTRPCKNLKSAGAGTNIPHMFEKEKISYKELEAAVKTLTWGGDCYMYGLLAAGYMDLCIETLLSPYDFCALVPVVEGAGGVMSDWNGKPLTIKSDGRVVATGDAGVHKEILKLLN